MHFTLAVTPTGVLRFGFRSRGKAQVGRSRRSINGCRDIEQAAGNLARRTQVIAVMDRKADFWGLSTSTAGMGKWRS